jgi:hypothetical protein
MGSRKSICGSRTHSGQPKVNIWSNLMYDHIFGQFSINGQVYLDMLEPLHFSRHVMDVLSALFPGRWIGKRGSTLWPHSRPDLTKPNFFFWSHVKNYIYKGKIKALKNM